MANRIYIKNMVCPRCIMAVKQILDTLNLKYTFVDLGQVELVKELETNDKLRFSEELRKIGFEIIEDKRARLIEQIKKVILEIIWKDYENTLKTNFSEYISQKLARDYNYLSNLFSEVEALTIEKYIILQKIERVKELLVYDQLTLSEIADRMRYSSVAYLSNQFKQITGFTPTEFKKQKQRPRKFIDQINN